MNKIMDMILRDGRNPYGSKGGYVSSDRMSDYNDDYARRNSRRDYNYDMKRDYASGYKEGMRDGMDMAMRDRATYNERSRDYEDDMRRDYGKPEYFSKKDMETWKSLMRNNDGTRGEHFRKEQVKHACQQAGIDCEKYGEDVFCLAMNREYSDGVMTAKKYGVDIPEYYADKAKEFLEDKDFDGKPEAKLYAYYKTFVEKDD